MFLSFSLLFLIISNSQSNLFISNSQSNLFISNSLSPIYAYSQSAARWKNGTHRRWSYLTVDAFEPKRPQEEYFGMGSPEFTAWKTRCEKGVDQESDEESVASKDPDEESIQMRSPSPLK